MDVAAAFPSVARGCLLKRLREMKVDEDIVGWTGSFMQDKRVKMVIDEKEEEEMAVTAGPPQGSSVSPILFIIYVSGVHRAGEGDGLRGASPSSMMSPGSLTAGRYERSGQS